MLNTLTTMVIVCKFSDPKIKLKNCLSKQLHVSPCTRHLLKMDTALKDKPVSQSMNTMESMPALECQDALCHLPMLKSVNQLCLLKLVNIAFNMTDNKT